MIDHATRQAIRDHAGAYLQGDQDAGDTLQRRCVELIADGTVAELSATRLDIATARHRHASIRLSRRGTGHNANADANTALATIGRLLEHQIERLEADTAEAATRAVRATIRDQVREELAADPTAAVATIAANLGLDPLDVARAISEHRAAADRRT